jgi:hypothetical protein
MFSSATKHGKFLTIAWSLSVKPGDLVIARMPKVKRRKPTGVIMLYDWKTFEYYPWKKGNLGMIIELAEWDGAIVMADGNVGYVTQAIIEVLDEETLP